MNENKKESCLIIANDRQDTFVIISFIFMAQRRNDIKCILQQKCYVKNILLNTDKHHFIVYTNKKPIDTEAELCDSIINTKILIV